MTITEILDRLHESRQRIAVALDSAYRHAARVAEKGDASDYLGDLAFKATQAQAKVTECEMLVAVILQTKHHESRQKMTSKLEGTERAIQSLEILASGAKVSSRRNSVRRDAR